MRYIIISYKIRESKVYFRNYMYNTRYPDNKLFTSL